MSEWQFVPIEAHPFRPVARVPASVISGPKIFVSVPEEGTIGVDDETCFDSRVSRLRPQCCGLNRSEDASIVCRIHSEMESTSVIRKGIASTFNAPICFRKEAMSLVIHPWMMPIRCVVILPPI